MSAWGAHIAHCYQHKLSEIGEKKKVRTAKSTSYKCKLYDSNSAPQLLNKIQFWD
jgi:hypothetical protein